MKGPSNSLPDLPIYDVKAHLAEVQRLHAQYPYKDGGTCWRKLVINDMPTVPVQRFLAAVLYDNDICIPNEPTYEDRAYLTRMQRRLTMDMSPAFRALEEFIGPLTFYSKGQSTLTLPLHQAMGVDNAIGHAYNLALTEVSGEMLFPDLYERISRNLADASGTKRILAPKDSKLPPDEKLRTYLSGTPFLDLLTTTVPFNIPPDKWSSHGIILAPPNHGKSQLLGTLITTFLEEGIAPIVLDPHGDLFELLADRIPDAIILDPDTDPPALNFFDYGNLSHVDTLTTFSFLMSALSGGLSDKQGGIVPYLLKLLRSIPNASLETLRQLIDEKPKNLDASTFAPFIKALPDVDQGFFKNQFFTHTMQATKDAIGWKLYNALASDAFREMFSAPTNSFNADAALRDRRTVLVKGGRRSLGQHGMEVYLQFITSLFFSAALRRENIPIEKRTLSMLVVDEAHHVFNPQISNILTECRKYRLGFLGATQLVEQIPQEVKAAIYGATAIRFAGPISSNDAGILAREMYTTPDFIRSMVAVEKSHAEWACHVRGQNHCLKLTVPYGAVERMPIVPRVSKAATTERTANIAEPPAPTPQPAEPDRTPPSPDDLDGKRWR